jgi:predicted unusual protein kinase regulating ubiquinone biosynthesis (AarF/ABC1/UbiB family)
VLLDFGAVLHYQTDFLQPVKDMVLGACENNYPRIKKAAISFGMMQEEYPEEVHEDFSGLCQLLVEPFTYGHNAVPTNALNNKGEYRFAHSDLPKRAAKYAAKSALSQYFAMPPKEFAFLSRKLLGVYSFISALDAEFNSQKMLDKYLH